MATATRRLGPWRIRSYIPLVFIFFPSLWHDNRSGQVYCYCEHFTKYCLQQPLSRQFHVRQYLLKQTSFLTLSFPPSQLGLSHGILTAIFIFLSLVEFIKSLLKSHQNHTVSLLFYLLLNALISLLQSHRLSFYISCRIHWSLLQSHRLSPFL